MKFKTGESVVCIDDSFTWARKKYAMFKITWPTQGCCYVVRGYAIKGDYPAIVLRGIVNPRIPYNDGIWREAGFWEERFERAPSIDNLKQIAETISNMFPKAFERDMPELEDLEDANADA
jgi:hypothetical protein